MPSASPDFSDPTCSRRTVLAGVAGVPAGFLGRRSRRGLSTTRDSAPDARPTTVATWNVSLGVDLFELLEARSAEDVRETAGELFDGARRHPYEARAGAIADELVAADPDVVALQEAARIQTGPADSTATAADGDGELIADLLDSIRSALADRGRPYEVAASTVTTDVELPVEGESGLGTVRLTDRDVLLVRPGTEVRNAGGDTYDEQLQFPVPETDRTVTLRRGYCRAEVGPEAAALTAVSTHLESVSAASRDRQAEELLDALPAEGPVVVGGDFNSGPGTTTGTYDTVTETLTDAHRALRPDEDGYTCCRPSLIGAGGSQLTSRVDGLLARGGARPTAVERLGESPDDRVETTVEGDEVSAWPSDHAGVVGTFDVSASTATTRLSSTENRTAAGSPNGTKTVESTSDPTATLDGEAAEGASQTQPSGTSSGTGPGFGALAAGVAFVVALARRRN
ncbi:endonuclease/exonuclease/phosphatase family protein [Halosimplex sp. J119]